MSRPNVLRLDTEDGFTWAVVWPAYGFSPEDDVVGYESWHEAVYAATRPRMAASSNVSMAFSATSHLWSESDRWSL